MGARIVTEKKKKIGHRYIFRIVFESNDQWAYRQRQEAEANDEVSAPVGGDSDSSGHGPSTLCEQLGNQEPWNRSGTGGEHHHESNDEEDRAELQCWNFILW